MSTLYCLAIPKGENSKIRSLRDLTAEHLDLLKSIRENSFAAIEETFGVAKSKIRAYFHYLPSYYILHVHFEHVDRSATVGDTRERVDLDNVIQNIEMMGDYY